jgi:hypothetical protein
MKKLSKMPTSLPETIGIDLGDKVSHSCIVDHNGEVVEEGSFRNPDRTRGRRAIGVDQPRVEASGSGSLLAIPKTIPSMRASLRCWRVQICGCWRRSNIAAPNSKRNWP